LKGPQKSDSKNISEDLDDANSLEPKNDLCSEYVKFLIEEEQNKTVVKDEVKEVYNIIYLYYINILYKCCSYLINKIVFDFYLL